ncbi:hypothetical protein NFI96_003530 [Prochilodus magdalenae]|nr:hypothetical protein NFI96_003530 [Prochilodus magdalenae]
MFAFGTNVGSTEKSPAARVKPWQNMPLTPGRIPSFILPPKLHLNVSPRLSLRQAKESDEYSLLPPCSPEKSSPGCQSPLASPRFPAKLRFTPRLNRKRAKEDLSDSSSRAAMSLEHVEKVTTPYGFWTLAASPNVSRRESLFHRRAKSAGEKLSSSVSPHPWDSPKPNSAARNAKSSQETSCSIQKPERRGLKLLLRSPRLPVHLWFCQSVPVLVPTFSPSCQPSNPNHIRQAQISQ